MAFSLCLALKVLHPDVLKEMLTEEQFQDWVKYYKFRPFGHWVDTTMQAQMIAAWGGKIDDALPRVVEPINFDEMEDEEKVSLLPGSGGALEFLKGLQNGK